ncbi:unnamed protein product, partial [Rotaria sp. Silwood2]
MLQVLLDTPRSPTPTQDVIRGCHLVNDYDGKNSIQLIPNDISIFQETYTPDTAIQWYSRDSFVYRAFNKACRMLDSDAIIEFHSFVKDLDAQLKQLHCQQINDGTLLPLTVYRGQTTWGRDDIEKICANVGHLISMNTFLSTSTNREVANMYVSGGDKNTSVIFEITVNDIKNNKYYPPFAHIRQFSQFEGEDEVLFGMSSIFKVISVEDQIQHKIVKLELSSFDEDKNVQKLMDEVQSYLYQVCGKQISFIQFKQLFTNTSQRHARPFTELMKFFLTDLIQLFIISTYEKQGCMKELIDKEPALHELVMKTDTDDVRPNETSICLLFDMLNNFLSSKRKNLHEQLSSDDKDLTSLLRLGGFLSFTNDFDKSIRYFQTLSKYDWINDKFKAFIHMMLGFNYELANKKVMAMESFDYAFELFQSSMPPWLATFIVSSHPESHNANQTVNRLKPLINQEHTDSEIQEKLRLSTLGYICLQQQNTIDALNRWEEALEIVSHIPPSMETIFNGMIYIQMASAYFKLNNMSKALDVMEKAMNYIESYYPSTHRMFASLNLMYGYYLMQNDKHSEAIECWMKSLKNPYFVDNKNFLAIIYTLLAIAAIQSGHIAEAEFYCEQARQYPLPSGISREFPNLVEAMPYFKTLFEQMGEDNGRKFIRIIFKNSQQYLWQMLSNENSVSECIDEETCTSEKLISMGDHYRYRGDLTRAEYYYVKALEKIKETESEQLWNVYRKMMKMNKNAHDQYRDYFIEQYSKYDDENPKHFQIITTLQIILFQFSLTQNEFELAFDCLIQSTLMNIKFWYYQINTDCASVSDLFDCFFQQNQIATIASILTRLIAIDFNDWIQHFLSRYFSSDHLYMNLAKVIHHKQIDSTFEEFKSKFCNDPSAKSILLFLETLLRLLRR